MVDRSSRPHRCPHQLDRRTERRIVGLRVTRRWGPARIAYHLGLNPSTVHKVLQRYRLPAAEVDRPGHRDPDQDLPSRQAPLRARRARRPGPRRHQEARPDPRRRRLAVPAGRQAGHAQNTAARAGHASRATPTSTTPSTTTPGWPTPRSSPMSARRPPSRSGDAPDAFFADHGITVKRVLTDNGSCYRSKLWAKTLGQHGSSTAAPAPTGPRPTARSNASTAPCSRNGPTPATTAQKPNAWPPTRPGSITYNHHRGHTALKGKSPIDRVPNLPGQNT